MKKAFTLIELGIVVAIIAIIAAIAIPNLIAESKKQQSHEHMPVIPPAEGHIGERFIVTKQGWFEAGFKNNQREILVIRDVITGKAYLAITGCGCTELYEDKQGKTHVTTEE